MSLTFETLTDAQVGDALDDLARLRVEVFRAWPYLYDGDPANEAAYLRSYENAEGAILVAARDGARVVGCATGMPLERHEDASDVPLGDLGLRKEQVFYCAESVLLPAYRGQGAGHAFFDRREAHARDLGFGVSMFCGIERPEDHPLKPADARPLAPFWEKRGYRARDAHVTMTWRDIDEDTPSEKRLRVWTKPL
ncbi:GNAT family N-acetyltransferase [Palleronia sp.]|uniref:GNAT family N-acetyltransferase n=1 Tax=Palleronia sp. TaxID=1940284 RepID=UPI0035C87B7D